MAGATNDLDVLLVEDNPGDARLVEHHLDDPAVAHFVDDVSLTHVETLDEAAESLQTDSFDVLLLDLGLTGSTGLATLGRASEIVDGQPIIVLTGLDDRETAMEAIERGAQDYLPKGELDGDRLVRALRYAVVRRKQARSMQRRQEELEFFNSILRHDILNGMHVIMTRSDALVDSLDGEQAEHARTIRKWSDDIVDLTATVRSILGTLANESGPELEPVALGPVLDDVAKRIETKAAGTAVSISQEPDLAVNADGLLGDVLGNIGTNAVEHGGTDPVVEISATNHDDVVRITIADDGPGVENERKESIFGQGQKGTTSSGTGFGLYFVDSMVEAYDGRVWVEDSDRGGAAFVVELPAA